MSVSTTSHRNTVGAPPTRPTPPPRKPITVVFITKYHTKTGSILYHLTFSNNKEHLANSSDILTWISPCTLQFYEHLLREETSIMRINLQERVDHVNDREVDADTVFPPFSPPLPCARSSCVVCRNETGYLNFSNGEGERWTYLNFTGCGSPSH